MKKLRAILQLLAGIAIVVVLLFGVNKASVLAEFSIPPSSIEADAVYTTTIDETVLRFLVLERVKQGANLRALRSTGRGVPIPDEGVLKLASGIGPPTLRWTSVSTRHYGRQLLLDTLRTTADSWHFMAFGAFAFIGPIMFCVFRWGVLLRAQGFKFSLGRMTALYFIGQFFNSFLPGGLSGDLVKAYYIVGETHEKRTEAVATIFMDRVLGFFALVLLTVAVMCARLGFFLGDPRLRVVLLFNIGLMAGAIATLAAVFRKSALERSALMKRIEKHTRLGDILTRVHTACHTCLKSRGVVVKTLLFSLGNHIVFIVCCAAGIGTALGIRLSLFDYLAVFPAINAVAAIPLTPGGLGTRDGATVYLLGAMDVPEARAILLSLLIYIAMLLWSLVGGVVYMFYRRGGGDVARDAWRAAEECDSES